MSWRLLDSGHGTPAWNMALDEALLECLERPVLRLYRWRPQAISLGRFQRLSEVDVPDTIARVRRITGGGAIHHREDELTYSIVAPYAALGGRGSPKIAYRAVHEAIAAGLESLGLRSREGPLPDPPPLRGGGLCYDRATEYDLKIGARKLVGSAQRRKGAGFLQHGSIPLSRDPFAGGAVSLEELLGRKPQPDEVARAVIDGFRRSLRLDLEPSSPTEAELSSARSLETAKYAASAWTADQA